jgi:homoserine dehydrogenase
MNLVPVVVLGPGAVGRALLAGLVAGRPRHAGLGFRFQVVAIADSRATVWGAPELHDDRLMRLALGKAAGESLADQADATEGTPGRERAAGNDAANHGAAGRLPGILVDTTADETAPLLAGFAAAGWGLVLANKLPLVGAQSDFEAVTRGGRRSRWETTVASALPVIGPLLGLVDAGDRIHAVRGCVSGTLAFVIDRIEAGAPLSTAVREAVQRGFAEPDPRADLSGLDVARKALIVARTAGIPADLKDVVRESLYPASWDELSLPEYFDRLPELDARMAARVAAGAGGLRYTIEVTPDGIAAGLTILDAEDPLARAGTTDSTVVVESDLFDANPLVVSGRGAGPTVTAAGVLSDMVSLARDAA